MDSPMDCFYVSEHCGIAVRSPGSANLLALVLRCHQDAAGVFASPALAAGRPPVLPSRVSRIWLLADGSEYRAVVMCRLRDDAESSGMSRNIIKKALGDWGVTQLLDDVQLISDELVANAWRHGTASASRRRAGPATGGPVWLYLARGGGEVLCAVADVSDEPPVLRQPRWDDEAGRGLHVVDALSDAWDWIALPGRGKVVWSILSSSATRLK